MRTGSFDDAAGGNRELGHPEFRFFFWLCAICAVLISITLLYAQQLGARGPGAREQECVVFTTRLDVSRRSMFVTCTPPAPATKAAR